MSTTSKYVRTICEIGIFAALGFVLDELQGIISKGLFINGGSIGFAMIAVLIIGYRRGWLPALLTGLIMGLFDIATSAYILHPAQLFLDYILPYALVAVGCLCKCICSAAFAWRAWPVCTRTPARTMRLSAAWSTKSASSTAWAMSIISSSCGISSITPRRRGSWSGPGAAAGWAPSWPICWALPWWIRSSTTCSLNAC